jgi:hypothetical protein
MRALEQLKVSAISIGLALGLASSAANASFNAGPQVSGSVSSTVIRSGAETWDYRFTVFNTSVDNSVTSYEIPWFDDAGITNITGPSGWNYSTSESAFGPYPAMSLVWNYPANPIAPGESLSGFGFTASYAPVKGPFALGFDNGAMFMGDPAIPGSPLAGDAGYTKPFPVTSVPEPETYAMMLAGLGLLGFAARRRKMAQH